MPNRPKFQFDAWKEEEHLRKHHFSFLSAMRLWDVKAVEADLGLKNGEYRYCRIAPLDGTLYVVIFTYRLGSIRLISARAANEKEANIYAEKKD